MKRILCTALTLLLTGVIILSLCACTNPDNPQENTTTTLTESDTTYSQITPQEAKSIMDSEKDFVILDTREQYEFDEGHIKNAILIPYTEIEARAENELPNKDQLILVYCRSGRRSKIAAQSLADMGYTNVKEFGGIIDWPYEVVK